MCYIFTINNFLKKDFTRVILQSSCSLLWLLNRSACQPLLHCFLFRGGEPNAFINAHNKPYFLVKRSSLFKYSVPLWCFRFRLLSLLQLLSSQEYEISKIVTISFFPPLLLQSRRNPQSPHCMTKLRRVLFCGQRVTR